MGLAAETRGKPRRVDTATAVAVAERIRTRAETMAIPVGAGISERITVSIGVAAAPEHATERTALIRIADAALYQAKAGGESGLRRRKWPMPRPSSPWSLSAHYRSPPVDLGRTMRSAF